MLGPTLARENGLPVALRPRERDVLAALALEHPGSTSAASLIEVVWPVAPPRTARVTLQNHVARLRRALGDGAVLTDAGAYRLGSEWTLDVERFELAIARARRQAASGDHAAARAGLQGALALVRGHAFDDLPESDAVRSARDRHAQQRATAEDELVLALIATGEHVTAIAALSSLVAAEPLREARWMMLALALYRDGQRRESIEALQRGRAALRELSGLDAGPAMEVLEGLIFDDDRSLHVAPPASLVGSTGVVDADDDALDVFVGRRDVLAEVRLLLDRVNDDRSATSIRVAGPTGIGKTALAERIAVQATIDGWHVVRTSCRSVRSLPLEPFGDIVREVLEHQPDAGEMLDRALLADLATLWSPNTTPGGDVGEAVIDALSQHATRVPTLVIVDDAEHVGPTASRLLDRLAKLAAPLVVLLVGGDHRDGSDGIVIELAGLDAGDVGRLLDRLSSDLVSDDLRSAIHRTTGGNPALVRRAAEQGRDDSIFSAALDGLSQHALATAQLVAVVGAPVSVDVITAATRDDDLDVTLAVDEAVGGGVLLRRDTNRIDVSAGVRDVILGRLDGATTIDLHDRIGSALLALGDALGAAPHLLAASDRDADRAIAAAERAARVAHAATMFEEAADLIGAAGAVAVEHLGSDHPRVLSLKLGEAELRRRAGEERHVELVWDVVRRSEAARDERSFVSAATALCSLGPLTEAGIFRAEVADVVERALAICTDPALRAECAGQAALFYSMSGNVDRCRDLFGEALQSARAVDDDRTLLAVLGSVYVALNHPDDWALRAELAPEMLALAERLGDDDGRFQALHLYFSTQIMFSDPLLRTTFAAQEALAARLRSASRRWMAGYQAMCLAYLDGRLEDALAIADEGVAQRWLARSRRESTYWMARLVCLPGLGRTAELLADIDRAIETQPGLPAWRAPSAWIGALCGDDERVRRECDAIDCGSALPRDMPWSGATMLLGRAVARIGDAERAARIADLLAPHAGLFTWVGSMTVGPFDLALAELHLVLGRPDEARAHLATAQRLCDRLQAWVYQPELDALAAKLA